MRNLHLHVVLAGLMLAGACYTTPSGSGAAIGAVAGGVAGSAVGGGAGLILGAAAGGAFGYTVGRSMEEADRRRVAYALQAGEPVVWRNAHTGNVYRVQPMDSRYQGGRECRDFRVITEVDGQANEVFGVACRRPDGRWEAVSG
ncbi:MAG: hypothetical protein KF773_36565 [Deltaproteobacteria bacterium]|nr:hypothetical protein [Deltaproteobacteria bacterium]